MVHLYKTNLRMKEFNSKLKKWDENYHQYMDLDLLREVVEDFNWSVFPALVDELPDGIVLEFHQISFFFSESFLNFGEINVTVKQEGEGFFRPLFSLLDKVKLTKEFDKPLLKDIVPGQNSKEKVRNEIWNKLVLIGHYLPSLLASV